MMMAYDKSLVAEDRFDAESGASLHRTDYLSRMGIEATNSWIADHPTSFEGKAPFGCNERIGRAMMQISVEALASKFKMLKADKKVARICQMLDGEA